MEKLFATVMTAMTGWIGYVHTSRPSRKECDKNHLIFDAKMAGLHDKIDIICGKIDKTNELITRHIMNGCK